MAEVKYPLEHFKVGLNLNMKSFLLSQSILTEYNASISYCLNPLISLPCEQTFNEFFIRELKPGARPIECAESDDVAVCAADCRLMAFNCVEESTRFWVKVLPATLCLGIIIMQMSLTINEWIFTCRGESFLFKDFWEKK